MVVRVMNKLINFHQMFMWEVFYKNLVLYKYISVFISG